jgi:hypothetical protein
MTVKDFFNKNSERVIGQKAAPLPCRATYIIQLDGILDPDLFVVAYMSKGKLHNACDVDPDESINQAMIKALSVVGNKCDW